MAKWTKDKKTNPIISETDSTYDEDGVRISRSEVVHSHYSISPSLKMVSLIGQC